METRRPLGKIGGRFSPAASSSNHNLSSGVGRIDQYSRDGGIPHHNSGDARQYAAAPQGENLTGLANMLPALSRSLNTLMKASESLHGSVGSLRQIAELGLRWGESPEVDQHFQDIMHEVYSTMESVHQSRVDAMSAIGLHFFKGGEIAPVCQDVPAGLYHAPSGMASASSMREEWPMPHPRDRPPPAYTTPSEEHFFPAAEPQPQGQSGQALLLEALKSMVLQGRGDGQNADLENLCSLLTKQDQQGQHNQQQRRQHSASVLRENPSLAQYQWAGQRNSFPQHHRQPPYSAQFPLQPPMEQPCQATGPLGVGEEAPQTMNPALRDVERMLQEQLRNSGASQQQQPQQQQFRGAGRGGPASSGGGGNSRTLPPPLATLWKVAEEGDNGSAGYQASAASDSAAPHESLSGLPAGITSTLAAQLIARTLGVDGNRDGLASSIQRHSENLRMNAGSHPLHDVSGTDMVGADRLQRIPMAPTSNNYVVKNTFIEPADETGPEEGMRVSSVLFRSEQVRRRAPTADAEDAVCAGDAGKGGMPDGMLR